MAVISDSSLTELAADILRDAAQAYDPYTELSAVIAATNVGAFTGFNATGSFAAVTGSFAALTGSFRAAGAEAPTEPPVTLRRVFKLPGRLPGIQLPEEPELAAMARSAPIMDALSTLARWIGREGRLVTEDDDLAAPDAADASRLLGVRPDRLAFLWEYALTASWVELDDSAGRRQTRAVIGPTAWRWTQGDDRGALHAWAAIFAAITAGVLETIARTDPHRSRKLDFQGHGVALAVMLFLSRQSGLTTRDAEELVRDGTLGERPSSRRKRVWNAWVQEHGEPAHQLLAELSAIGAVRLPPGTHGPVTLTPIALWALREQFMLDKISVRVLPQPSPRMHGAELVALYETTSKAEFDAACRGWLLGRDPDRTARELLMYAGSSAPRERLIAVDVARRIGVPGMHAWLDAMKRQELRGYARVTLSMMAADLPESSLPLILDPDPDDLAWLATDLLALACGNDDPDPDEVAAQFAEAVPAGEEAWTLGLMAQSSHPDVARVLEVIGSYHPDRRVARDARKAARAIAGQGRRAGGHLTHMFTVGR